MLWTEKQGLTFYRVLPWAHRGVRRWGSLHAIPKAPRAIPAQRAAPVRQPSATLNVPLPGARYAGNTGQVPVVDESFDTPRGSQSARVENRRQSFAQAGGGSSVRAGAIRRGVIRHP